MDIILSLILLMTPVELGTQANKLYITDHDLTIESVEHDDYMLDYIETPFIDENKLTNLMSKLNNKVYEKPKNAFINKNGEIKEGQVGFALNHKKFLQYFFQFFYQGNPEKIKIPKIKIYPRVNSELLAAISENQLSSFTTYYKESNVERSHNIYLSADAINNHVVFPGETFSFNETVGERTLDKGYLRAPVIVRGELSEDIGGGICQVSSTLYNAANLKGVEIVERYSHSRSVPYVPPGKDAAVSWWGPDFVFKNNYNQPILIRTHVQHGNLVIRIFSAEDVSYRR